MLLHHESILEYVYCKFLVCVQLLMKISVSVINDRLHYILSHFTSNQLLIYIFESQRCSSQIFYSIKIVKNIYVYENN